MIETRQQKTFFMLSPTTFDVREVQGLATDKPSDWYVQGEGVLVIGTQIFNTMPEVRVKATNIILEKEQQLENLKEVWRKM